MSSNSNVLIGKQKWQEFIKVTYKDIPEKLYRLSLQNYDWCWQAFSHLRHQIGCHALVSRE